tara:strand:+ start:338 stop:1480 length:1143 start_codon:yes stop_codon:yes gene_type:complete
MTKFFIKYGVVLYLVNTIFLSIESTFAIGNLIFLIVMSSYALLLLLNSSFFTNVILNKIFLIYLLINLINLIYFLCFHSFGDFEALKFLLARFVQFSIIAASIYYNFIYYKSYFFRHLSVFLFILVIACLVGNTDFFSGRYRGVIWNPNMLASFSSIGFAIVLITINKYKRIDILMMTIFLIISLLTGSRGVLIAIPLAFIIKFGFSLKNFLYSLLAIILYFSIAQLDLNTSLNRFSEKTIFSSRLDNWNYGIQNILTKPLFGFGLDKYSGETEYIPYFERGLGRSLTAHNGYISLFIQYGMIFGSIILFLIFRYCISLFYFFKSYSDNIIKVNLYIILTTLIASIYETMLTGINEFQTILFWFSLAFLIFYKKRIINES